MRSGTIRKTSDLLHQSKMYSEKLITFCRLAVSGNLVING